MRWAYLEEFGGQFQDVVDQGQLLFLVGLFLHLEIEVNLPKVRVGGESERPGGRASERASERADLFGEQDGGVAVLFAGLGAQRDEPEQKEGQAGAPDEQLPVVVAVEEGLVDVQQLQKGREREAAAAEGVGGRRRRLPERSRQRPRRARAGRRRKR